MFIYENVEMLLVRERERERERERDRDDGLDLRTDGTLLYFASYLLNSRCDHTFKAPPSTFLTGLIKTISQRKSTCLHQGRAQGSFCSDCPLFLTNHPSCGGLRLCVYMIFITSTQFSSGSQITQLVSTVPLSRSSLVTKYLIDMSVKGQFVKMARLEFELASNATR